VKGGKATPLLLYFIQTVKTVEHAPVATQLLLQHKGSWSMLAK
jgi:hypothetical protein